MVSLYRKPIFQRDPRTVEKVKAKSKKWRGRFRDVDGLKIEAAHNGSPIEKIPGRDRVIMYVLSPWTGFRKREIGSLTRQSF